MIKYLKKFNNKEAFLYLVFGVLTTLLNYIVYFSLIQMDIKYYFANIIAWIIAVLFAFFTNKFYVFQSKFLRINILIPEFISFTIARILSLIFEEAFLFLTIELFDMNHTLSKLSASVFVVIFNYFASKFFIFKNKKSSINSNTNNSTLKGGNNE